MVSCETLRLLEPCLSSERGVVGDELADEAAMPLCINFIVSSRDDTVLDAIFPASGFPQPFQCRASGSKREPPAVGRAVCHDEQRGDRATATWPTRRLGQQRQFANGRDENPPSQVRRAISIGIWLIGRLFVGASSAGVAGRRWSLECKFHCKAFFFCSCMSALSIIAT